MSTEDVNNAAGETPKDTADESQKETSSSSTRNDADDVAGSPIPKSTESKEVPTDSKSSNSSESKKEDTSTPARKQRRISGKVLPPVKLSGDKQRDALMFYGQLSHGGAETVSSKDAAKGIGVTPNTLLTYSAFFKSVGFITADKVSSGYIPAKEVIEYSNLRGGPDNDMATIQLRPIIEKTWFGQDIIGKLKLDNKVTASQLKSLLAVSAEVDQQRASAQLAQLVEWAEATQLIISNGDGSYSLGNISNGNQTPPPPVLPPPPVGIDGILEAVSQTFDFRTILRLEPESRTKLMEAVETIEKCVKELKGDGQSVST